VVGRPSAASAHKMGKDSKIAWTHHTFSPWWGCSHVSPGCVRCYAEVWAKRTGHDVWGAKGDRRTFPEKHWREPLAWNAAAQRAGERRRVFCASMADVFEDHPALPPERAKLWPLIEATPNLDWLLLTKRIENVAGMAPWGGKLARERVDRNLRGEPGMGRPPRPDPAGTSRHRPVPLLRAPNRPCGPGAVPRTRWPIVDDLRR
jgi:hypothetical protein